MTLLNFETPSRIPEIEPIHRLALFENRQAELDILYKLTGEYVVNEYLIIQDKDQPVAV
jgi:hypothetical protein